MQTPIPQWLSQFYKSVETSPTFLQEMNKQLEEDFQKHFSLNLVSDTKLLEPAPDSFTIQYNQSMGYFIGNLIVLSTNNGYWVTVAWMSHDQNQVIQPYESVAPHQIRFWWAELPIEEIRRDIKVSHQPLAFPIENFRFKIAYQVKLWPDITLEISSSKLDLKAIENCLAQAQNDWNEKGKGLIHKIGKITSSSKKACQVAIDLGSALENGLEFILQRFEKSEIAIDSILISN